MRRICLWFASTATVVVLLFGYHTSTSSELSAAAPPVIASTPSGSNTSSSAGSGSSASASSARSPATSSAKASSQASSQASSKASAQTYTGNAAQTQFGPVQVAVAVSGGSITHVSVVEYPNGNPRDSQINTYALPILVDETVKAQSAAIDMVSGATYTSNGYLQSLQSALDQAGI